MGSERLGYLLVVNERVRKVFFFFFFLAWVKGWGVDGVSRRGSEATKAVSKKLAGQARSPAYHSHLNNNPSLNSLG